MYGKIDNKKVYLSVLGKLCRIIQKNSDIVGFWEDVKPSFNS